MCMLKLTKGFKKLFHASPTPLCNQTSHQVQIERHDKKVDVDRVGHSDAAIFRTELRTHVNLKQ